MSIIPPKGLMKGRIVFFKKNIIEVEDDITISIIIINIGKKTQKYLFFFLFFNFF